VDGGYFKKTLYSNYVDLRGNGESDVSSSGYIEG